jgi:hypothetical protein
MNENGFDGIHILVIKNVCNDIHTWIWDEKAIIEDLLC